MFPTGTALVRINSWLQVVCFYYKNKLKVKSGLCHPGLPSSSRPVNTLQSAKSVASPFNISHSPRRYIQIDMKINYINNIEYLNKRRQGSC